MTDLPPSNELPKAENSQAQGPLGHGRGRQGAWIALFILAIALGTRIAYAATKSLVLDEFHSHYHATQPSFSGFLEALSRDNHPPLSFLVIATAAEAFGRTELALRSPAILFSLMEIALVLRLVRVLGGTSLQAAMGAALLAASAMHFDYGTQARMYAPFALSITLTLTFLVEMLRREAPRRGIGVGLCLSAAAALYSHYFAFQYLACLFATAALLSGSVARARRLVLPILGAALLFAPWGLTGFREQLGHDLAPGGDDVTVLAFAESLMHLFAHNVSLAGPAARWVFVAGAAAGLGLAALGAAKLVRSERTRVAGALVAMTAFGVPLASWCAAQLVPRAGYTWHYILPSAAAACALAGVAAYSPRVRWIASGVVGLGAILIGLHLVAPASEDFRGAVAHAVAREAATSSSEVVRIVAVEWQPALFPQGQPYDYYAPRVAAISRMRETMIENGGFTVVDTDRLSEADRVLVVSRSLPGDQALHSFLRAAFPSRTSTNFGYGVDVIEYSR